MGDLVVRAGVDLPSFVADRHSAAVLLDDRLRPVHWTLGAVRFTLGRLVGSVPLPRLYPQRSARPVVAIIESVRETGHSVSMETVVTDGILDGTGPTRFVVEPVHDGSRVIGIRGRAERPDGSALYALRQDVAAVLPWAVGCSPEVAVAVAEIRCAARDAVKAELRPLVPQLRRAVHEERQRSLLGRLGQLPS